MNISQEIGEHSRGVSFSSRGSQVGDATILIVDDEPEIRRTVSMSLSSSGFNVVSCPDGLQALDLVNELQCTVVIVDLFLPGISGVETARKIRSINSDTEIIILTGDATPESALDGPHEYVFEFLKKPLELPLLLQTVERARAGILEPETGACTPQQPGKRARGPAKRDRDTRKTPSPEGARTRVPLRR